MPVDTLDADVLTRNWWAVVIRGILAIFFGLLTFLWPGVSAVVLLTLFGVYMFVDGLFAILSIVAGHDRREPWWMLLLEGFAGIAVGIVTFTAPGITALTLLYLIAFWAFVTGVFEIIAAVRLRKLITGEWLLGLSGVLSIALGVLLLANWRSGLLVLVLWLGVYACAFGAVTLALGLRLRSYTEPWHRERPAIHHGVEAQPRDSHA